MQTMPLLSVTTAQARAKGLGYDNTCGIRIPALDCNATFQSKHRAWRAALMSTRTNGPQVSIVLRSNPHAHSQLLN